MSRPYATIALSFFCVTPFALLSARQDKPQEELKCEDIYKNIQVFKGVPASDLIPAMEFMSASMKWDCTACHVKGDYSQVTPTIETTRKMVLLQRDINEKFFDGRLEVTCVTCHRGEEHPPNVPLPDGISVQHGRISNPPKAIDLVGKHITAAGTAHKVLTRTGTLTAPNDLTGETEALPLELIQVDDGRFRLVSGDRTVVFDGSQLTYHGSLLWGEPVAALSRVGRGVWGENPFAGLSGHLVSGRDRVGDRNVLVVRANRASTTSTEEMYLDAETGIMLRLVNMKRSTLGTALTVIEYEDYKTIEGSQMPMKVTVSFPAGKSWVMQFKESKASEIVDEALFKIGS